MSLSNVLTSQDLCDRLDLAQAGRRGRRTGPRQRGACPRRTRQQGQDASGDAAHAPSRPRPLHELSPTYTPSRDGVPLSKQEAPLSALWVMIMTAQGAIIARARHVGRVQQELCLDAAE